LNINTLKIAWDEIHLSGEINCYWFLPNDDLRYIVFSDGTIIDLLKQNRVVFRGDLYRGQSEDGAEIYLGEGLKWVGDSRYIGFEGQYFN
jgi:hypothetical protein